MISRLFLMRAAVAGLLLLPYCCHAQGHLADEVDLLMGVRGNSNCVMGPQLPHGSVNPSPQTPKGKHGGYIEGQPIRGFGQLHVSGTGWGRYGQIFLSPQTGFNAAEDGHDSPKSAEKATPYYYSVVLDRYGIQAEVAPTHHCAVYRFHYPAGGDGHLLLDIAHNIPRDIAPEVKGKFLGGHIAYDSKTSSLTGWGSYAGGFGSELPYRVYFAMVLGTALKEVQITDKGSEALYAQLQLAADTRLADVRVGISMNSVAHAQSYLAAETGAASLEMIKERARALWEQTLSSIQVSGGSEAERRQFYTALYHSFVMPRDRTGDHPEREGNTAHIDDHYCVWDTWRTKYPLLVLLQESFVSKTIRSFIDRFQYNGVCNPTFTSSLDWPEKQGGDDVDNIIADAFVKNVGGFDRQQAYRLLQWNAQHARHPDYLRLGWLPETGGKMSCSYEMEYAYNDFCTSQVANLLGDTVTAQQLRQRSAGWERLFNPSLQSHGYRGFIAPRRENGDWVAIDPAKGYGSWVAYFYEGNSWVYSLFTPHAFDRLIALCGGKDQLIQRLSYSFDHRLIDLSNEPGFLTPFLFTHCGRPDLTNKYVQQIRRNSFSLEKGYPDNEDSGAMGSWYVFTSMGLFPNAGQDYYYLLPPAFSNISLRMENGKTIHIEANRTAPGDTIISSVTLNGRPLNSTIIHHRDLADGATLRFQLTSKPH